MPKVSVLIPTYNRAHMISDAINSIINQTYKNIEIIVYDDGSTDNTKEIIWKFPDIKYINSKFNRGCAYARNILVSEASGEYICWQDSDDWSHNQRLQLQINAINNGADLVRASSIWLKQMTSEWSEPIKNLIGKRVVPKATTMFKIKDWIPIDIENSVGGSDKNWYVNMLRGRKECLLPQILYYMRIHNDRIGMWKRSRSINPQWHDRMMIYKKK